MTHSPTPWEIQTDPETGDHLLLAADGYVICFFGGINSDFVIQNENPVTELDNAELIMKAVNQHDHRS
jgi:hypothetical protein